MTDELIKKLRETLGDLNTLNPTKMRELIQATMETFKELQERFQSTDPIEREAAMRAVESLKESFEEEAKRVYEKVGMDHASISAFVKNPANFSQEEWETVADMSKELQKLKPTETQEQVRPLKKLRRSKVVRLVG